MTVTTQQRLHVLLALLIFGLMLGSAPPLLAAPSAAIGLSSPYTQDFDTLANTGTGNTWTDDSTIPGWYSSRVTYNASTGTGTSGGLYSFGADSNSERALGSLASGTTGTVYYGARFINDTGSTVVELTVSYTGEQWRNSGNASAHSLTFAYQMGATTLTSGTWTDVAALNFTGPITGGSAGALDGNDSANRVVISHTITGLSVPPNQEIWIRWADVDDAGSDHGLAIDDLTVTATTGAGFGNVEIDTGAGLAVSEATPTVSDSYTITLNPDPVDSVEITVTADGQTLVSDDDSTFANSIVLNFDDTTPSHTVYVRAVDDDILEDDPHTSTITHEITSSADPQQYPTSLTVIDAVVSVADNEVGPAVMVINEIYAYVGSGPLGDANGDGVTNFTHDEFVELVNITGAAINISGWTISDSVNVRYTFPAGTIVPDQCAVVVFGGGRPMGLFGGADVHVASGLGLNNDFDIVTLRDTGSTIIDQYTYYDVGTSEVDLNQSINRLPDFAPDVPMRPHVTVGNAAGGAPFSPGLQLDGSPFSGCTVPTHTLSLSVDNDTFSEAAGANAAELEIIRSNTTGDLTVFLYNPDTSELTLAASQVTLNDGQASTTVMINAVDDAVSDGPQVVNIWAGATGWPTTSLAITVTDDEAPVGPGATRIRDIQGTAHLSTLAGSSVTRVPGVVTAVANNGFYMQDPEPDADDSTSEGIFVFTSSRPTVQPGVAVLVSGTVGEFRPGGVNSTNLTTTQIAGPATFEAWGLSLPTSTVITPVIVGTGGRIPPNTVIDNDAVAGTPETPATPFDPAEDGIDFWESLEGMLVQISAPTVIGPTNKFGELWVVADGGADASNQNANGGLTISPTDFNPERIQLDDDLLTLIMPNANVGAELEPVVGVVAYNFGNFEVLAVERPVVLSDTLTRPVSGITANETTVTVATLNVLNLDPNDDDDDFDVAIGKFDDLAEIIVDSLNAPDIVVLQEVQDNSGGINDGVTSADVTAATLIDAIETAGGPTYEYVEIAPENNQDGGQPGGNIRVGFLYNPARVGFTPSGSAIYNTDGSVVCTAGQPSLSHNPVRIDPTNSAFNSSRKPIIAEFTFDDGETVHTIFVLGAHFNSKGGDEPLFGRYQPPALNSEAQRIQQAQVVRDFMVNGSTGLLDCDPNANIILAGDFNDFQWSAPLTTMMGSEFIAIIEQLDPEERYSYIFQGNSQTLDHILLSQSLQGVLQAAEVVRVNSEYYDQVTDHDPSIVALNWSLATTIYSVYLPLLLRP